MLDPMPTYPGEGLEPHGPEESCTECGSYLDTNDELRHGFCSEHMPRCCACNDPRPVRLLTCVECAEGYLGECRDCSGSVFLFHVDAHNECPSVLAAVAKIKAAAKEHFDHVQLEVLP